MQEATLENSLGSAISRDIRALREQMGGWLECKWPGVELANLGVPTGSGASSELLLLTLGGQYATYAVPETLIARISPAWSVYPTTDIDLQARCMNTAANFSDAPVPRVFAVESGASNELGRPFLLMERLEGRGAPDIPSYVLEGWLYQLDPASQSRVWRNGVSAIATLHQTDVRAGGLGEDCRLPSSGDTSLQRMLSYWSLYLEMVERGGDYPILRQAVDWLHVNAPVMESSEGLVWGDASLRNMLFKSLQPAALLDFEFAHVGLQHFDIAFYAVMDWVMASGFANDAPRLPGFPSIPATLDYYEELTGSRVSNRAYLCTMALTYSALSTTRVYQRLESAGNIAPEDVRTNPPLRMLESVLQGQTLPD